MNKAEDKDEMNTLFEETAKSLEITTICNEREREAVGRLVWVELKASVSWLREASGNGSYIDERLSLLVR
ncbi:unnamed protein product [Dovyalis caffra]|uniref:Uncharacterized protein n=1 Tax=Dovyalis caffra TaxID=77055 RepID=A0AAV1SP80_9ROSI|nr:unnamed protein product [Dovyalis caffra]